MIYLINNISELIFKLIILFVLSNSILFAQLENYYPQKELQQLRKSNFVESITEHHKEIKMDDSSLVSEWEKTFIIDSNGYCIKNIFENKTDQKKQYETDYEYDSRGNVLKKIINGHLENIFVYNDSNEVVEECFYKADSLIKCEKTYFDSLGNKTINTINLSDGQIDTISAYNYNYILVNGKFLYDYIQILPNDHKYTFDYDNKGRVVSRFTMNSKMDTVEYELTYYNDDEHKDSCIRYDSNPSASFKNRDIEKWVTTLDSNGNRISLLIYNRNDSLTGYIFTQYDENGNRIIDSLHYDSNDDFIYAEFDAYNNQIELKYITNGELIFLYEKKYIRDKLLTLDKYYNYKNNSITTKEYIYKFFE
ncbi:MAG: hypothetical protein WAU11_03055 [Ignavibacteriaceae bacterium]